MQSRQLSNRSFSIKEAKTEESSLGFPVIMLAILITSYFYVLPLGRYAVGGVLTDYRLYDFVFVAFFLIVGLKEFPKVQWLWQQRDSLFHWMFWLIFLVCISLSLTMLLSGLRSFMPGVIRAVRFSYLLLTASFVTTLANTPKRFKFILLVFYLNIVLQAILAFAQGLKWLPNFWPQYWLVSYGNFPVGTLSPHHQHIGIVMLLGIAMTLAFFQHTKNYILRGLLLLILGLMTAVPIFAGIRTAWIGFLGIVLGYFLVYGARGFPGLVVVGLGLFALFYTSQDLVRAPLEEQIQNRVLSQVDVGGVEELYGERTVIYFEYLPKGLQRYPWVAITGTGFQNIKYIIGATGAHNNFLQAWLELGIIGFIVFCRFLWNIGRQIKLVEAERPNDLASAAAHAAWIALIAIIITMFAGEVIWGQYSMFTLTGHVMTLMSLGVASLYWDTWTGKQVWGRPEYQPYTVHRQLVPSGQTATTPLRLAPHPRPVGSEKSVQPRSLRTQEQLNNPGHLTDPFSSQGKNIDS
jgi:O-antigen ligase